MQDLLIDTNIYAYAMKGDQGVVSILRRCRKIGICAVSIGELLIGRPIPTNDIWIASVAFQHGLRMFTRDSHFTNIPGLVVVS